MEYRSQSWDAVEIILFYAIQALYQYWSSATAGFKAYHNEFHDIVAPTEATFTVD
jgi:hypothetical protein